MTTEMTKAVCWELATPSTGILGLRILLAGRFVGTQELSTDNARPRWRFSDYGTPVAASEAAVTLTEKFEREHAALLVVPPGEVILHPSEMLAMADHKPISPSLRARIFTSLQRRDSRVTAGAPSAAPV